ncbi:hypothetical protein TGP89_419930 [Toxoplasma gondii p89]|uniref:Uncharacterized protein n=1 Tax=Toxoplasma gondii p89 TaxID=943119 RepID=A0A086JZI7_TOXGO|nr:hypothetical protein TGP89_419930 [Toxoplasma gondii p89]
MTKNTVCSIERPLRCPAVHAGSPYAEVARKIRRNSRRTISKYERLLVSKTGELENLSLQPTDRHRQTDTQTDRQRRTHGFTQLRRADVDVSPPLLFSACSLLSVHYLSLESAPSVRSPFLFGGLSGSAGPVNDQSFFDLRVTKWRFSCVFCLCFRGCFSPSTSVANAFFAAEKNSREIRKR